MIGRFIPLIAGALFAVGLALSGMTQPSKIVGFLDFFGDWDPSLVFVMGGAIAVYFPVYRLVADRPKPFADTAFSLPTKRDIDAKLLGGAFLFGIGWAVSGYCPGPALSSIASGLTQPVFFVIAMISGMMLYRALATRKKPPGSLDG